MKSPRLKKWRRWMGRILVVLVLWLALFILEENVRGRILLGRYQAELRAQGEKLTLAKLDFPRPPMDGKRTAGLLALTNQLNALRKDCPFPVDSVARLRLAAPEHAIVRAQQLDLGVARKPYARLSERASWADLAEQAARVVDTLAKLKTVVAQPAAGVAIDYTQGMEVRLPHLNVVRDGANWLALAALNDLHHRDYAAAASNIVAIAALSRFQNNEQFTYAQLARTKAVEAGLNMTWEALQTSGWTEEQLVSLQQAWHTSSVIDDTVSALEVERVLNRDYFEQARHLAGWNKLRMNLLYQTQFGSGGYSLRAFFSDAGRSLQAIAWRLAWLDQDEVRFLQRWQLALDRIRDAVARRAWSAAHLSDDNFPTARHRYDGWRFLLSDCLAPNIEHTLLPLFEFETRREMTVAAIAIERHRLRTGKLPSDLAAVVPEYLPQLPHDWMDGNPLRYHPKADGTFILYSVGADGHDDGGDPKPADRPRALSMWDGRDAVWPQPATKAEVAAAEVRRQ